MRSNRNYIGPDLSTLTAAIAHSPIVVTLAAAQPFLPEGFDDQDVAILEWIGTEARHAKRSYLYLTLKERCGPAFYAAPPWITLKRGRVGGRSNPAS
jgi:hypothetical protein